jgi:hypothetical protein
MGDKGRDVLIVTISGVLPILIRCNRESSATPLACVMGVSVTAWALQLHNQSHHNSSTEPEFRSHILREGLDRPRSWMNVTILRPSYSTSTNLLGHYGLHMDRNGLCGGVASP